MAGDILIVKRRGHTTSMKVTKAVQSGYAPDHKIVINLDNYKDVALFLHDLKDLYNVKIDKAIEEYQKGRSKTWPF